MTQQEQIQHDFEAAQKNGFTGTQDSFKQQYYPQNQNQEQVGGGGDVAQFKQAVNEIAEDQRFRMREFPPQLTNPKTEADSDKIWGYDKKWVIGLAVVGVIIIAIAGAFIARAVRKSGQKTADGGGGGNGGNGSAVAGEKAPESVAAAPLTQGN